MDFYDPVDAALEKLETARLFPEKKAALVDLIQSRDSNVLPAVRGSLLRMRDPNLLLLGTRLALARWGEAFFRAIEFPNLDQEGKVNLVRIARMSRRGEEFLLLGLQDEDPAVRMESTRIMARQEGPLTEAQFEMLSLLARDEREPDVRIAAVRALANHPDDQSMDILEKVVTGNSGDPEITETVDRARTAYTEHQRATRRSNDGLPIARSTGGDIAGGTPGFSAKDKKDLIRYGLAFAAVLVAFFWSASFVQGLESPNHSETTYCGDCITCSVCGLVHTEMTADVRCKVCGGTLVPRPPKEVLAGPTLKTRSELEPDRLRM